MNTKQETLDELKRMGEVVLYAWLGEDELGSGAIGLKQAMWPAGMIPLAVIEADRHKLEAPALVAQLRLQGQLFKKRIYLLRFAVTDIVEVIDHE